MEHSYQERPFPPSLWHATAIPFDAAPPLDDDVEIDVAIVGAGYTGLSTALHLAEAGMTVCVLDAEQPGWGGSGRNGGQVIPGLKYDPDELITRLGPEVGERVVKLAGTAANTVFDIIARYQIPCDPVRNGWIQTADSPSMLRQVEKRAQQWQQRGANVQLLNEQEVAQRIGVDGHKGGLIDYRAGSIQPLSYARGLAIAARQNGALIFGDSRVSSVQRNGDAWRVVTANGGAVSSKAVVLATNAYTDNLWPGLRQSILAANSFIVATRPFASADAGSILGGGEVTSSAKRLLIYIRRDAQGRLILGGRGPFNDPSAWTEWKHIERTLEHLFPRLAPFEIEYRWAGRLAVTADYLPHIHTPDKGLYIALGYNGRGIAMATTVGKGLAAHIASHGHEPLPLPATPIRPIPMHGLQRLYMAAGVTWYRFLDAVS